MSLRTCVLGVCCALAIAACSTSDDPSGVRERTPEPAARPAPAARGHIVFLGDSLTAGLGLKREDSFPALIQQKLNARAYPFDVVNAGVSGDTSAGGLRRLDWALDGEARILVVALGANDGLRGLSVGDMKQNLSTIIERAQRRGVTVLLCGMEAPPNFGLVFTRQYRLAFRDLADTYDVAFIPFLLDGVAGIPALNQSDGIHPNAEGARRVADLVWSSLEPLVKVASAS